MRVIDADEVIKKISNYDISQQADLYLLGRVIGTIDSTPTIDTVKHGKWLIMTTFDRMGRFKDYEIECSCCNGIYRARSISLVEQKYRCCPACGARMDAEDGE